MGHEKVLDSTQLLHHGIHLILVCLAHLLTYLVHLFFHLKKEAKGAL